MTGKYDVDYRRLGLLLLPMTLRRPRLTALVQVLMAPLVRLGRELTDYRALKAYRLGHNGQTCRLRAVLNDRFDPVLRGIRITEAEGTVASLRIFLRETERFTRIRRRDGEGQVCIYRRGFGGIGGLDFWVELPSRLRGVASEDEVRAVVNIYRLASKRFGLTYYNNE